MKVSKNFTLREFVSPYMLKKFGNNSIRFLDSRLIVGVQKLRDFLGFPIYINGYFRGHHFTQSGFREYASKNYSWYSQHRFGRAVDIKVRAIGNKALYKLILNNQKLLREMGFTTIENIKYTPTWVHLDMRALPEGYPKDKLLVVNPKSDEEYAVGIVEYFRNKYKNIIHD